MSISIDDFRCMRQGIQLFELTQQDIDLLSPINQRSKNQHHALLLLHGFSSSPAVYRFLLPELSGYDAVICPQLPGHAQNLEAFAKTRAKDWLLFVEQTYRQLSNEYEHVDVMGLSLGGLLACHLSSHFTLHHLYLLAPALDLHLSINKTLIVLHALRWLGFKQIRAHAGNLYSIKHCEIAYRKLPLSIISELLTLIKQFSFTLPTCPTDLFLGRHDKVIDTQQVANRFTQQKHTTIHWLEDSAHVLPLDTDLNLIIQCVKQHIK